MWVGTAPKGEEMSLRSKLKLPREHGAWAMLYVPFVLGVAVVWRINWAVVALAGDRSAVHFARIAARLVACADASP